METKNPWKKPTTMVHGISTNTGETEAGGSTRVQCQPGVHGEFQVNWGHTMKTCL